MRQYKENNARQWALENNVKFFSLFSMCKESIKNLPEVVVASTDWNLEQRKYR